MTIRVPLALALLAPLAALGGACAAAPPRPPDTPLAAVERAKVYDARGQTHACAAPQTDCPPIAPDRDLADRCALSGFRMVQCGCDAFCTGDTSQQAKQYYDAEGRQKTCEKAAPECSPPAASATFQDACTEKGFHLQICGCEWLCSGRFSG